MAVSATPRIADPGSRVAVAYSGGRDSTALLHAVCMQAQEASIEVLAFHIHHGLSSHADAWASHCEQQCADWAGRGLPVRLMTTRLTGKPGPAQSIEAWARDGRYAALTQAAHQADVDLLLLAHHQRDQAETLLLQALRGAGVAGLAGMPATQWRDGVCWARPWLSQPREMIDAYVALHGLKHIEDDSNVDCRYARNRLRLAVWPSLSAAFPQADASLAQAATWARQALELQQEIAASDLLALDGPSGLDASGVQALSVARASNALRAWIHQETGEAAPASLIVRLQEEWHSAQGAWPCAGGLLRLYRGRLTWAPGAARPEPPSQIVKLGLAGTYPQADWGGAWRLESVASGGVSTALLQDLTLRGREGGEQFQRAPGSAIRSLKKAYQEAGVPAWQREGPLLFSGAQLVFAAGLGVDARVLASQGEPQLGLQWLPAP